MSSERCIVIGVAGSGFRKRNGNHTRLVSDSRLCRSANLRSIQIPVGIAQWDATASARNWKPTCGLSPTLPGLRLKRPVQWPGWATFWQTVIHPARFEFAQYFQPEDFRTIFYLPVGAPVHQPGTEARVAAHLLRRLFFCPSSPQIH